MENNQNSLTKSLFLFIILALLAQVIIIALYQNKKTAKQTVVSKAQEINCPAVTGKETYQNKILSVGPNIAANNSPQNYKQIRELYNCKNSKESSVQTSYIPVTVIYDLFFLKGGLEGIQQNLEELKKYGLYPIIRVASYTDNKGVWIKLYPPTDALIMGENLGKALQNTKDFPEPPIVVYLNEVNLHEEWGGKADPEEFSQSFSSFAEGLKKGGNYQLFFPPISYGADGKNGISPSVFIDQVFKSNKLTAKFDGIALNIYGQNYSDIESQYNNQKSAFSSGLKTVITELGPIRRGTADTSCDAVWENNLTPIVSGIITNKLTIATTACFGAQTVPAIIADYDTQPKATLFTLSEKGQISNDNTTNTTNTANNQNQQKNQQQNQTTNNSATTINYNPQNPKANTNFQVIVSSQTGFQWVHLKISDKDNKLVWEAPKDGSQPKVSKAGANFQWQYDVKGINNGEYKTIFYINCHQGCKEQANRSLFIGENKTNETQQAKTTENQTTTQSKNANQNQPSSQATQISQTSTNQIPLQFLWEKDKLTIQGDFLTQLKLETTKICYAIVKNSTDCNNGQDKKCMEDRKCVSTSKKEDLKYNANTVSIAYPPDNRPQGVCIETKPNTEAGAKGNLVCLVPPKI